MALFRTLSQWARSSAAVCHWSDRRAGGGHESIRRLSGRTSTSQGGTFSANPLPITAGLAAMKHQDHAAFAELDELGYVVRDGIDRLFQKGGRRAPSLERPLYFEFVRWPKPE